jgi:hypothetical protein
MKDIESLELPPSAFLLQQREEEVMYNKDCMFCFGSLAIILFFSMIILIHLL